MRQLTARTIRNIAVLSVLAGTVMSVGVQAQYQQRGGNSRQNNSNQQQSPIAIAHRTLEQAARVMESALPIYDGHRHRSIELAKMAAKEVVEAANGAPADPLAGTPGHKTAAQRAGLVKKGGNVALSQFTAAQISASNIKMQKGLVLLQQGLSQVQAIGNDPGGHMGDAVVFLNHAINAANTGLQYVSTAR